MFNYKIPAEMEFRHLVILIFMIEITEGTAVPDFGAASPCNTCCQGAPGSSGSPGNNGNNGSPGRDGLPGRDGYPGNPGDQGLPGPLGPVGPSGPRGPSGERGDQGLRGFPGKVGPVGMSGIPGLNGTDGRDGVKGQKGTSGRDGFKGQKGASGSTGDSGTSTARRSAFSVIKTNMQTTSASSTKVDYNVVETNEGNDFDISTDRFTCQVPGFYVFHFYAYSHVASSSQGLDLSLIKDGSVKTTARTEVTDTMIGGSVILHLAVGNQVWIRFANFEEGIDCSSDKRCSFSGYLLYED